MNDAQHNSYLANMVQFFEATGNLMWPKLTPPFGSYLVSYSIHLVILQGFSRLVAQNASHVGGDLLAPAQFIVGGESESGPLDTHRAIFFFAFADGRRLHLPDCTAHIRR